MLNAFKKLEKKINSELRKKSFKNASSERPSASGVLNQIKLQLKPNTSTEKQWTSSKDFIKNFDLEQQLNKPLLSPQAIDAATKITSAIDNFFTACSYAPPTSQWGWAANVTGATYQITNSIIQGDIQGAAISLLFLIPGLKNAGALQRSITMSVELGGAQAVKNGAFGFLKPPKDVIWQQHKKDFINFVNNFRASKESVKNFFKVSMPYIFSSLPVASSLIKQKPENYNQDNEPQEDQQDEVDRQQSFNECIKNFNQATDQIYTECDKAFSEMLKEDPAQFAVRKHEYSSGGGTIPQGFNQKYPLPEMYRGLDK